MSAFPKLKVNDLVRSRTELPMLGTGTKGRLEIDDQDPRLFHVRPVPIDSRPIDRLPIKAGTVFEVVGVFPTADAEEMPGKRYKLSLDRFELDRLDEMDRQATEDEFASLNRILGEEQLMPFFTFADEDQLELVDAFDNRIPGENTVEVWGGGDYFPWTITVEFPDADQPIYYEIESWLCDDASADDDEFGYSLSLTPLFIPERHPVLFLKIRPNEDDSYYDTPRIDYFSEGNISFQVRPDEMEMTIRIHACIVIDLDKGEWWYLS